MNPFKNFVEVVKKTEKAFRTFEENWKKYDGRARFGGRIVRTWDRKLK